MWTEGSACPRDLTVSGETLHKELAQPGTEVTVLWGSPGPVQKDMRCTVRDLPLREDRRRTDVSKL